MPLQLGGVETERPQTIVWNPDIPVECFEAGQRIADLRKRGFRSGCIDATSGSTTLWPPSRDPNLGVFRILSDNGDDRIVWDRRDANQVREAYKKFKEFMDKGYTAYAVGEDGKRGHKITEFNPHLEELALEILMVPSTYPG